jgi:hypothetical protein
MAEVRKLDSRRRAVFPEQFSPGDLFLEEMVGEDEVVFRRVKPKEVPLVKVSLRGGHLMIDAPLESKRIAKAVREERDSR